MSETVLGVEQSVTGRHWQLKPYSEHLALTIAQRHNLPDIVARLLASRDLTPDQVPGFLNPKIRDLLPDPSAFTDMDRAVTRIVEALLAHQRIAIYGDYDVDGATSSALLKRFFSAIGVDVRVYIPDRLREGYGPNAAALRSLRDEGIDLVVTVDCGTLSFEPLTVAREIGLDVIVVDHHKAEPELPDCVALVNPNRLDDDSGQGQVAAVGMAFLLAVGINRALREAGWYASQSMKEPKLTQWLDLVALGTVCDVVPLEGVNRAFVTQGLKIMAQTDNVGIKSLLAAANVDRAPSTYHAGFVLGPRVNAGGRVGRADLGTTLLSTTSPEEATRIAQELDQFNLERRAIEDGVLEQAVEQAASLNAAGQADGILIVHGSGWHPGVIGIVASRLKDRFGRPTIVIGVEEGVGKGSGRSIPGIDLGAAVIAAQQQGLLVNGGGHAMAAGLTVTEDKIADLTAFLRDAMARQSAAEAQSSQKSLVIDGVLNLSGMTRDLSDQIDAVGPFGSGNPQPLFALQGARIVKANVVGTNHVSVILGGSEGPARGKAIAFRVADRPLGQHLLASQGQTVALAGRLEPDDWNGRRGVQLQIVDAALTG